jgi:hypothetical protein
MRDTAGTPDRDRRLGSGRVILPKDIEATHVKAMIGVEMTQEDRVDGQGVSEALQCTERTAAQIKQDAPGAAGLCGLEEIATRRGFNAGEGTRTADDGEFHAIPPANWSAAPNSGPRNRRPIDSNSSGLPVVKNA